MYRPFSHTMKIIKQELQSVLCCLDSETDTIDGVCSTTSVFEARLTLRMSWQKKTLSLFFGVCVIALFCNNKILFSPNLVFCRWTITWNQKHKVAIVPLFFRFHFHHILTIYCSLHLNASIFLNALKYFVFSFYLMISSLIQCNSDF